jgi:hypothetical protein
VIQGLAEARRILVGAKEAGAGAFLAALLRDRGDLGKVAIFATREAAPYFEQVGFVVTEVASEGDAERARSAFEEFAPDLVLVGASAGASHEKLLLLEARRRGIKVYSFVDHFWNLWQRFADEKTAARWTYLPDQIFVVNPLMRDRMVRGGCPTDRLQIIEHPVLDQSVPRSSSPSPAETFRELKVPESSRAILFVSEYVFPSSALWNWDQPREEDIAGLLKTLLLSVQNLNAKGTRKTVILVKLHPQEPRSRWEWLLQDFSPSLYRVIQAYDKSRLIDAVDQVWGLNSMLLLEALERKKKVYSYHSTGGAPEEREAWLSHWQPKVVEAQTTEEVDSILEAGTP